MKPPGILLCFIYFIIKTTFASEIKYKDCMTESGLPDLTKSEFSQAINGFLKTGEMPPRPIRKFVLCALKNNGVLTEDLQLTNLKFENNRTLNDTKLLDATKNIVDVIPEDYAFKVYVALAHPKKALELFKKSHE